MHWPRICGLAASAGVRLRATGNGDQRTSPYLFLFIKIRQPDKNIRTVNAVKQAENRLVESPTQG